jgi:hypothetical protein
MNLYELTYTWMPFRSRVTSTHLRIWRGTWNVVLVQYQVLVYQKMDERPCNHLNWSFKLWIWSTESIYKLRCASYSKATQPIRIYKVKPEALCQFNIDSLDRLTDLLNYESEALSQFINLGVSFISKATQLIKAHKSQIWSTESV